MIAPTPSSLHSAAWVDLLAEFKEKCNPNMCWHHSGLNTASKFCQSVPALPSPAQGAAVCVSVPDRQERQQHGVNPRNRGAESPCEITTTRGRCQVSTAGHICRGVQQSDPLSSARDTGLQGTVGKHHLEITGYCTNMARQLQIPAFFQSLLEVPFLWCVPNSFDSSASTNS